MQDADTTTGSLSDEMVGSLQRDWNIIHTASLFGPAPGDSEILEPVVILPHLEIPLGNVATLGIAVAAIGAAMNAFAQTLPPVPGLSR